LEGLAAQFNSMAAALQESYTGLERKVEARTHEIEEKGRQLEVANQHKSEFLANMSHELRTPLNSLLILSDQLCKNPDGNLTPKQREFAKTIHSSGNDLLMLINDILDLSKIESGTVVVDISEVRLDDLRNFFERTFRHVAEAKSVDFEIQAGLDLPASMFTDVKRLQQILKNLLSNAFKFTHQGQVTLTLDRATSGWSADNEDLNRADQVLAMSVRDTGIGISPDKQQIIFEAFQQADGSTSRKYGGTGLGLAISRELSRLLGGEIRLVSSPGKGSSFTFYLPQTYSPPRPVRRHAVGLAEAATAAAQAPALVAEMVAQATGGVVLRNGATLAAPSGGSLAPGPEAVPQLVNEVGDDRENIRPGDRVLLIVENDLGFARIVLDACREKGFKGLVTSLGAAALAMTREFKPEAMTLDLHLPDIDGWRVLDRLKNDVLTRHIPVCVISTEEARERALTSGALAFTPKPIKTREVLDQLLCRIEDFANRPVKNLVVLEQDAGQRRHLLEVLDGTDIQITCVSDATALQILRERRVDGLVLTGTPSELDPDAIADALRQGGTPVPLPVIVYTEHGASGDGDAWKRFADVFTIRRAHSPERLFDLVCFFMHRSVAKLPENRRQLLENLHSSSKVLPGKKVLIVDDDMRNIFALSTVLEDHDVITVSADNGRDAIRLLQEQPDVDIVLMDIMMPEMDGIDTMREIRKIAHLKSLPIVAVTAKAMKGDREKCIEAGAWDYLSKPVDTEQMLALLRAWLHR
jgi:signal transduction histidine kinase/CheY-like chemotaxis protein